jgi:hypothetical protein
VDLSPLVDHIAELEREVRRHAEAATVWQIRAMQAEERLKALSAGEVAQDALETRSVPPETAETPNPTGEPLTGLRGWWRRLWDGV